MKKLIAFALPHFTLLSYLIKKPLVLVGVVPTVIVANLVVDFAAVAWILFYFFTADFITGLAGSYCDWKKSNHKDRWFFGKGEGFSSNKAKMMGVKLIVYITVPLQLISLQKVLFLKNFKYERLSEAEFEWATISLIVFCLIEGFSIFHENLPKCGFNIWHIIKKIIGFYKTVKNEIKTE